MTIIWSGLSVGAVYTLVAVGFNIVMRQSGIFNFAQAQFVLLGVFLSWYLLTDVGLPWYAVVIILVIVGAVLGMIEELVAIRPLGRHMTGHGTLVTTVGAFVAIDGTILVLWGQTPETFSFVGGSAPFTLLGGRLVPVDLWLIASAVVGVIALEIISRRTVWGLAGRAVTDDPDAVKLRGINVNWLRLSSFMVAGAFGCAFGPLIGPQTGADLDLALPLTIYAFVGLAVGGFGSYVGCLVGCMGVGTIDALSSRYLNVNYPPLILFALLLLALLIKPTGFFGSRAGRAV